MSTQEIVKEYTKDDLTVVWKPSVCTHSTLCWKGLLSVFNPKKRPWISLEGASKEAIMNQVKQCPSGALSFYLEGEDTKENDPSSEQEVVDITIQQGGPALISVPVSITHGDGRIEKKKKVALCRCGQSSNKPYCDGTHKQVTFE